MYAMNSKDKLLLELYKAIGTPEEIIKRLDSPYPAADEGYSPLPHTVTKAVREDFHLCAGALENGGVAFIEKIPPHQRKEFSNIPAAVLKVFEGYAPCPWEENFEEDGRPDSGLYVDDGEGKVPVKPYSPPNDGLEWTR